jgi:hypothetical protein
MTRKSGISEELRGFKIPLQLPLYINREQRMSRLCSQASKRKSIGKTEIDTRIHYSSALAIAIP